MLLFEQQWLVPVAVLAGSCIWETYLLQCWCLLALGNDNYIVSVWATVCGLLEIVIA